MLPISIKRYFIVLIFFIAGCNNQDNPWPAIAKKDLDYIKQMIEENHPGYVDPYNPQFKTQLEKSYQNVIGQLQYVQSLDAVMNLTNEFVASFADVHFVVYFRFKRQSTTWAGIKIERRKNQFLVTKVADDWPIALPTPGSILISCDGKPADEIMNWDILRYRFANYTDEFPRVKYASKLFINDGIGSRQLPGNCIFRNQDNNEVTFPISWQFFNSLEPEWDSSISFTKDTFRVQADEDDLVWVRIPTFKLFTADPAMEQFHDLISSLEQMKITAEHRVVLDIRNNGGGGSYYGEQILERILGERTYHALLMQHLIKNPPPQKLWRTSQDNLIQIQKTALRLKNDEIAAAYIEKLFSTMEQDLRKGHTFTQSPPHIFQQQLEAADSLPEIPLSLPQLLLITDHFCASACLTFANHVLALPNSIHLGQQTYSDTPYTEPLRYYDPVELPSKLGSFYYPSTTQGNPQALTPAYHFDGDINDAIAVKDWVKNLLKEKLSLQ